MKKLLILCMFVLFSSMVYAEPSYQLSTHILDISKGNPASNVEVVLYKLSKNGTWEQAGKGITDKNGRIGTFLSEEKDNRGVYKFQFRVAPYFKAQKLKSIYPYIEVVFEIKDKSHYHIPITVSANGYGTYRGS